jgi:hypothetical protein
MDLYGLVGYECFGQVVLPYGLSETFNAPSAPLRSEERGIPFSVRVCDDKIIFDILPYASSAFNNA